MSPHEKPHRMSRMSSGSHRSPRPACRRRRL